MLKTLIEWSLTMNKSSLANIFECSIFLPAIQYNRIANYKAKNFSPQHRRGGLLESDVKLIYMSWLLSTEGAQLLETQPKVREKSKPTTERKVG